MSLHVIVIHKHALHLLQQSCRYGRVHAAGHSDRSRDVAEAGGTHSVADKVEMIGAEGRRGGH